MELFGERWAEGLVAAAEADRELRAIAGEAAVGFLLASESRSLLLDVRGLRVTACADPDLNCSWDFSVRAPVSVWERLFSADPRPPAQHVLGLWAREPALQVDGSRLALMQHLRVVQRLLELGREVSSGPVPQEAPVEPGSGVEPITGRYVWLTFQGRRYRIYFEEAGAGPPLLLLHTAGADSRQYAGLLNAPELLARRRLVAFDLPWHGRSFPPDGWWEEEYRLTTDFYAGFVSCFLAAAGLQQPVVLGCSMGGEIVLELALKHAGQFRAAIGVESTDRVDGRFLRWGHHPQVNESEAVASWVAGLMAPGSPERHRREQWWIYSQGGAGVFNGDIEFYSREWDARDRVGSIDTGRCPVYLLTGEYDYSCTPELSEATAGRIPGARFQVMEGLGHFPMGENPARFLTYLLPILDELA
jgi:pimeloyl-ACP methyl ester carboxylesterase